VRSRDNQKSDVTLQDYSLTSGGGDLLPCLWVISSTVQGIQGATISLGGGAVVIGRGLPLGESPKLADRRISKSHVRIAVQDQQSVSVTDLGSRNGTHVDGERITSAAVTPSQVIRVGGTFLQFLPDAREVLRPGPGDVVSARFIGASPAARRIRARVRQLVGLDVGVLVTGPPGSGKERLADALHAARQQPGPLVNLNCSVLTDQLAASELFGHVRGAFTGARSSRQGAFRRAHGGTLLLDEVGDLPLGVQPKLLRALQDGRFQPVGSDDEVQVDVRVVAATNRDIGAMVRAKDFRGDLYSRLAGSVINLPPLAERPADIVVLAQHFLGAGRVLHPLAVEQLLVHSWPYNVRDLKAVISLLGGRPSPVKLTGPARDKLRSDQELSMPEVYPAPALEAEPAVRWPETDLERVEVLEQLLEQCGGNVSQAARLLGKRHTSVRRWIERYNVDLSRYRP